MNKIVIAALASIFITTTTAVSFAQGPGANGRENGSQSQFKRGGRHPKIEERLERLAKYLGLTQDQKSKIKAILVDTAKQVKAVRQDKSLTDNAKRAKIVEIRKASRKEIASVLTPEQKKKLAELRRRHRGEGRGIDDEKHAKGNTGAPHNEDDND